MDVYDKSFYGRLDKIVENNKVLSDIASSDGNKVSKTFKKLPKYLSNGYQLLRLYLLKPLDSKDFNLRLDNLYTEKIYRLICFRHKSNQMKSFLVVAIKIY